MTENASAAVLENSPDGLAENPPELLVSRSWRRGFWSLVATQFQCAFNDNAYKNLIVFIILGTAIEKADRDRLVLVAGALFSVPFILFSYDGRVSRGSVSKRTVTIATKLFEIGVIAFAIVGRAWQSLPREMAAIFLASTQAAFPLGPLREPCPVMRMLLKRSRWQAQSCRTAFVQFRSESGSVRYILNRCSMAVL